MHTLRSRPLYCLLHFFACHSTVCLLLLAQNSRFAQHSNRAGFSWFSLAAGRVANGLPLSTFRLRNAFLNLDCKVREAFKYTPSAVLALFLFCQFFSSSVRLRRSPRFKFVKELRQGVRAGVEVIDPGVPFSAFIPPRFVVDCSLSSVDISIS